MIEPHARLHVTVARGNIYVPFETCETYLKDVEAIALLPHEKGILLLPLIQDSAGGLLLKIRNLQRDCIVNAQEFFRNNDYREDFKEKICDVEWISDRAALLIIDVPKM